MPKSGIVVLPRNTQPASRTRAAGGASTALGVRIAAAVPTGVGTPLLAIFSFSVIGTPSSGLSCRPLRQRCSEALACASAPSASTRYIALIFGSQASIRMSAALVASTGEIAPVR